jgi:polyferredoxin
LHKHVQKKDVAGLIRNAKVIATVVTFVVIVIYGSLISAKLWGGKPENRSNMSSAFIISKSTLPAQIADEYGLSGPSLKKALGLRDKGDLRKTLSQLNISPDEAQYRIKKAVAFQKQESTKNWKKIALKFFLWTVFLVFVFIKLRASKITPVSRKLFLATAIIIFGIILGADPSPMGTVKDAIVLWGKDRIIFPPRMIALAVFLLMVVLANKFICSWGCQFGTLQEFAFRINRNKKDTVGIIHQIKAPFVLSNTIRVLFFIAFVVVAVLFSFDIVSPIDPFKIFNPSSMVIVGIIFVAVILVASIFVYRPWCHFFCPFGLIGWLFERISVNKISVNYGTCIGCEACAKACPSTVMNAILKQGCVTPDCFSCGTCLEVCPTKSIAFNTRKRERPPEGKFSK